MLKAHPGTVAVLEGHADRAGPSGHNYNLSAKRSAAVRAELIDRGVPAQRVRLRPVGESDPVVSTGDGVRHPANRVVNIVIGRQDG